MKYKVETSSHEYWYKYGTDVKHREAGPAITFKTGRKDWIQDNQYWLGGEMR
jgi:hypothetical protein